MRHQVSYSSAGSTAEMLVVDTFTNREMVQLTSEPDQSLERLAHLLQEVGQYLELLRDGLGPA